MSLSPSRDPNWYRAMLIRLSEMMKARGATQKEAIILASQFVGLTIADCPPEEHSAVLEVAIRAMNTAFAGKVMQVDTRQHFKDS